MPWTPTVADGTTIFLDTGAAWTEIRGARNFSVGAPSKEKIDISELRDSVKKELGGKVTFGDITFTLMVDPTETTHTTIETQSNTAGSKDRIYVKYPGISQYVLYEGSFGGFAESFENGQIIEAQVTFTLSAAPVRSATVPTA
jgi:hypothetical protein